MGFAADDTAREVVLRSRGLGGNCRVFEKTLYFFLHGHGLCAFFLLFFFFSFRCYVGLMIVSVLSTKNGLCAFLHHTLS